METDLLAPLLGATLHNERTDTARTAALIHHGDAKERPYGNERRPQASNQRNSIARGLAPIGTLGNGKTRRL